MAIALSQKAIGPIGTFDCYLSTTKRLWEFDMEKPFQFGHAHFCNRHVALPALASSS
jgi:hypothetical protein